MSVLIATLLVPPKVKSLAFNETLECSPETDVTIRIDEVGVHKQTPTRAYGPKKRRVSKASRPISSHARYKQKKFAKKRVEARQKRRVAFAAKCTASYAEKLPMVQTTVITVDWAHKHRFCLTGPSVDDGMKSLVAFLLKNHLLSHHLVFITDGAHILKTKIEEYFGYCSYQHNMDWYHVEHYVAPLVRLGVAGSKDEKNEAVKQVLTYLWFYDLNGAKRFIKAHKGAHAAANNYLDRAISYIERKAYALSCFALRNELHLPNSSSLVEKYNDLVVAERQKHSVASWSQLGSNTEAIFKCADINDQLWNFCTANEQIEWFKAC